MTPAAIVSAVLGAARLAVLAVPDRAGIVLEKVADALDGVPELIAELGDGDWTEADVTALQAGIAAALAEVPGVPGWHARKIAGGVAAVVALVVAAARSDSPHRTERRIKSRERSRAAMRAALTSALPAPDERGVVP